MLAEYLVNALGLLPVRVAWKVALPRATEFVTLTKKSQILICPTITVIDEYVVFIEKPLMVLSDTAPFVIGVDPAELSMTARTTKESKFA